MSRTFGTTDEGIASFNRLAGAGRSEDMPDRAVIPLMVAVSAAFLVGVIAAVLQIHGGGAIALGFVAGIGVMAAGAFSVAGGDAPARDKNLIGALRGGLAVGLFVFVYIGTLAFLRDGSFVLALLCYAAGRRSTALLITRVRWRSGEKEEEPLPERRRKEHGTEPRGPASGGEAGPGAARGSSREELEADLPADRQRSG